MRTLPVLLVLGMPALLAACASGGPSSAPLPRYGIGDSYQFSDGTTRSVTSSSGRSVFWRLDKQGSLVTTRDVLLPPLVERAPGLEVRNSLGEDPSLFPLIPGKHVTFNSVTEWLPRGGRGARQSHQYWRCRVGGRASVQTPAGSFHTIRVDCAVRQPGSAQVMHQRYFYAPSIGFYVRREDRAGDGPSHRINLTAYSVGNPALADSALSQRIAAIQQALEHHVSGDPVTWRDPSSDASGSVDPLLTVRSRLYGWCREFRERISAAERRYDLKGTACRERGGTWQVREITPFRTASR